MVIKFFNTIFKIQDLVYTFREIRITEEIVDFFINCVKEKGEKIIK